MHTNRLKKLLRDLKREEPSIRRAAAESLSEGDERTIYPLIKALKDDNFGVQDAAMRSLMELKSEATAYMVLPLLRENSLLRNTALIILKEMGNISVPLLYTLLNDKDDDIRKFALDLIYDIQYCDYPEKLVEMLSGDANANVRAAAAKAIGSLKYKKAIPQLVASFKDEEWVCFSALEALTELNNEKAVHSIISLLDSPSETIRFAAIEVLGKVSSEDSIKALSEHISKIDGFEKYSAIKSLVQTGHAEPFPGMSDALIEMLYSEDWDDRLVAIKGLVAIKEIKAVRLMIDVAGSLDMSDMENEDNMYTIKQSIQSLDCDSILIAVLNDDSMRLGGKVIAIEIVGDLKCREAVPSLIKLLNSDDRDVRRSSIKSLGQIDDDKARDCLIEAIRDHDSHVRKSAVTALGKIGDASSFDHLMNMLQLEKYNDVIDEFIIALLHIDSTLFLSRIDGLNDNIRKIASKYNADIDTGVSC